jgi:hypothetical protein
MNRHTADYLDILGALISIFALLRTFDWNLRYKAQDLIQRRRIKRTAPCKRTSEHPHGVGAEAHDEVLQ